MDSTGGTTTDDARIARRSLLKKAAAAGAAAWAAPVVIESVTNPAGALTCAPGNYYVVYNLNIAERTPLANTGCTQTGTNTTAAAIGLTLSYNGTCTTSDGGNSIAHILSTDGNCRPVRIRVNGGCECTITSVFAHVHNRGNGTCPQTGGNYCWGAGSTISVPGTDPQCLRIVTGALNTADVTVQPNYTNVTNPPCAGYSGLHWGSPNQPNGYLVVNVTCTG